MKQPVPEELISAYFDGEVTPDERQRVEQLLQGSSELRQMLDETSKLSAVLHSVPKEVAPAALSKNVMREIESRVPTAPISSRNFGLKREWIAVGTGLFATAASLMIYVSMMPANLEQKIGLNENARLEPAPAAPIPAVANSHIASNGNGIGVNLGHDVRSSNDLSGFSNGIQSHDLSKADEQRSGLVSHPKLNSAPELAVAKSAAGTTLEASSSNGNFPQQSAGSEFSIVTPSKELFFQSLKKGEIVVQYTPNPNNTVAVVELAVVDIERGVEEMTVLLQRVLRDTKSNEEMESEKAKARAMTMGLGLPAAGSSDDLIVLYVRASGDQLADALAESSRHPDIYRQVSPLLPIALPAADESSVARNAESDRKSSTDSASQSVADVTRLRPNKDTGMKSANASEQQVEAEALSVVRSYADSQGIEVSETSEQDKLGESREGISRILNEVIIGRPSSQSNSSVIANSDSFSAETSVAQSPSEPDEQVRSYSAFRIPTAKQRSHRAQAANRAATAKPYGQIAVPQKATQKNQNIPAPTAQSPDGLKQGSDPQLMRMLIILKPEQDVPAAAPTAP